MRVASRPSQPVVRSLRVPFLAARCPASAGRHCRVSRGPSDTARMSSPPPAALAEQNRHLQRRLPSGRPVMALRCQVHRSRAPLRRPPRRLATVLDSILAPATRSTMHRSSVRQHWHDPTSGRVLGARCNDPGCRPARRTVSRSRQKGSGSRCGGRPPDRTRVPQSRLSGPANLPRNAGSRRRSRSARD
jgi:hypothetical protein